MSESFFECRHKRQQANFWPLNIGINWIYLSNSIVSKLVFGRELGWHWGEEMGCLKLKNVVQKSIYSHAQVWQSCTYTVLSECVRIVLWLRPLWMENWAEGCNRMIRISRKSRGWRRCWNVRTGAGEPGGNRDSCLSVRSSWSDPRTCLSLPQLISDRRFPLAPTTTLNLAPFKALQTLIVSIRSFIVIVG